MDWIGLNSVLRPRQHSIGYMGDKSYKGKHRKIKQKYTHKYEIVHAKKIQHI